jgi:hypothetical protein
MRFFANPETKNLLRLPMLLNQEAPDGCFSKKIGTKYGGKKVVPMLHTGFLCPDCLGAVKMIC